MTPPNSKNTWLIADTHFNHENIIKYCNRPFQTSEDMDKSMISNWNSVVNSFDEVYVLGDFLFHKGDDKLCQEILDQLKGLKYLIMGNHDHYDPDHYVSAGFRWVSPLPVILDEFYVLSHHPQYVQENGVYVNIFGHIHNNPMYKTVSPRSYCVSVERINYTPIAFEEVKAKIKECSKDE